MQSKRGSFIETVVSTATGFVVTMLIYQFVVPVFWDLNTSFTENMGITALFTVVSVARGYALRRVFNLATNKKNKSHELDRNYR